MTSLIKNASDTNKTLHERIKNLESDVEVSGASETVSENEDKGKLKEYPSKFYFKTLKKEKHVKFDKYLMILEERNDFLTAHEDNSFELTPIPKFIAFTVLVIREKFEEELKNDVCFIESKSYPSNMVINELAESIYLNCDEYHSVVTITENINCFTLFLVLLTYLQKMEIRIFQCSRETMRFINDQPIFKYLRPRDFIILNQIHSFISHCFISKGPSSSLDSFDNQGQNFSLNLIDDLLKTYYFDATLNRIEEISRRNKLHQLYYTDLRAIRSTSHRYLVRFILRNCLYFVRRYVSHTSSKLRLLRKEDPKTSAITSVPFISSFALFRMAQFLSVSLTEIKGYPDSLENRINYLLNILTIHMENIWFRQRKISQLIESTEIEHCHEFCLCGI